MTIKNAKNEKKNTSYKLTFGTWMKTILSSLNLLSYLSLLHHHLCIIPLIFVYSTTFIKILSYFFMFFLLFSSSGSSVCISSCCSVFWFKNLELQERAFCSHLLWVHGHWLLLLLEFTTSYIITLLFSRQYLHIISINSSQGMAMRDGCCLMVWSFA